MTPLPQPPDNPGDFDIYEELARLRRTINSFAGTGNVYGEATNNGGQFFKWLLGISAVLIPLMFGTIMLQQSNSNREQGIQGEQIKGLKEQQQASQTQLATLQTSESAMQIEITTLFDRLVKERGRNP